MPTGQPQQKILLDAKHLVFEIVCGEIQRLLTPAGIPVLVLKGPHVAAGLYDEPFQRDYCDLDLLVHPAHFFQATRILLANGFRLLNINCRRLVSEKANYQLLLHSPRGVAIELHRALADPSLYRSDVSGYFRRSETFMFGELQNRGLATEDLLLHLCLHFGKRHFMTCEIKHLQDIAHLLKKRKVQWSEFLSRVRFARCRIITYYGLRAVMEQSGVSIPPQVIETLKPGPLRRRIVEKFIDPSVFPIYRGVDESAGIKGRIANLLLLDSLPRMLLSLLSFTRRSLMDQILLWRPLQRVWLSRHPLREWMVVE